VLIFLLLFRFVLEKNSWANFLNCEWGVLRNTVLKFGKNVLNFIGISHKMKVLINRAKEL